MTHRATWKGSREIQEQPGSPRRVKSAAGIQITRVFRGPYEALVAAEPAIGATLEGTAGVFVDSVETVPDAAGPLGPGTMTIVASTPDPDSDGQSPEAPIYEVDWTQLEKPLEQHPRYQSTGDKPLNEQDLVDIENWKNETDRTLRSQGKYRSADGNEVTLSLNAKDLAFKILRGQSSYIVAAPVVRVTSRTYAKPLTSATGTKGHPPAAAGYPPGYEWVKTADRAMRQGSRGTWERIEEWTGADTWDGDIYL